MRKLVTFVLMVCILPYVTGCEGFNDYTLTGHLWDTDVSPDHIGPASSPELRVFQDLNRKDFLVQYDETRDRDGVIKRRAYYLLANEKRVNAGKKPHFVPAEKASGLGAIPISTNKVVDTNFVAAGGVIVVLGDDYRHFSIYSVNGELGEFYLPVYPDWTKRSERIALTPLTVVGDVMIYTAIAAALLGLAYLASGGAASN